MTTATIKTVSRFEARMDGGDTKRVSIVKFYDDNVDNPGFLGRIDFYAIGHTLPKDYLWIVDDDEEYIVISMPVTQFQSVVHLTEQTLTDATGAQGPSLLLEINVCRGNTPYVEGIGSLRRQLPNQSAPAVAAHETIHLHTLS